MAAAAPPHRVLAPVSLQRWDSLTFLHWPFSAGTVQALLPRGLRPDLWEGRAWVGLTPFVMTAARIGTRPLAAVVSRFPETNLRTYVRGPDGGDGVWFLSLDAARGGFVLALRTTLGLPYRWADMSVRREGDRVAYSSRRRTGPAPRASSRIVVRPGDPIPADQLGDFEHYLTGRWSAYSSAHGRLWRTPITHRPWQLCHAKVDEIDEQLVQAAMLPAPTTSPVVHFSPGVPDVRVGTPRLVSSRCLVRAWSVRFAGFHGSVTSGGRAEKPVRLTWRQGAPGESRYRMRGRRHGRVGVGVGVGYMVDGPHHLLPPATVSVDAGRRLPRLPPPATVSVDAGRRPILEGWQGSARPSIRLCIDCGSA